MRDFAWAYEPVPATATPLGNMSTGYVTSIMSESAQWRRGELPENNLGAGAPGFMLARPRMMREPGSSGLGTFPLSRTRDTWGNLRVSPGTPNLSGSA